ncbi:uncharacterized protein LOC108743062 [Agrilus planipennis]|uniref:Uncharacterized protein LOC108743062 n=1 Tax=Agrilus planipennis TaxID=224129 RepID=A0A1W4XNC0_AGRPL|nr:uncharacterized protein LOC108743062 [Agrilus planipennis]XP_018333978.1 uncharacterized protein LOC108743062 [Agrilus planipennis]XP_018333979.1 uncharacterized protein LOC108743062 [Agrilus planipennis]
MTSKQRKIIGGWSQVLTRKPLEEFSVNIYGMVTNLDTLTTGAGWSPKKTTAPRFEGFDSVKILWTYGGEGCSPCSRPATSDEVNRIVQVTQNSKWDGVDFDDECNMNTDNIIEVMKSLKNEGKETSYGFIAGWDYNNPNNGSNGKKLNENVKKLACSGVCDKLVHYCYGAAMWSDEDIKNNVRQALERSINNGMPKENIILALTSAGLNDTNLNYFLDAIVDIDVGGLFIWAYHNLSKQQRKAILQKLPQ